MQIKVLGISGKRRIIFNIFVNFLKKKRFFLHFKTVIFYLFIVFLFHFAVFEEKRYFWV